MASIPGCERISESFTQLIGNSLSNKGHRHLAKSDIEVQGAGSFPAEILVGIEEFLDVPSLGIMDTEVQDFVAIMSGKESIVLEVGWIFSGALNELVIRGFGEILEAKGEVSCGPSCPMALEICRGQGSHGSHQRFGFAHRQ